MSQSTLKQRILKVNKRDRETVRTPLQDAYLKADYKQFRELLKNGANIDKPHLHTGRPLLHMVLLGEGRFFDAFFEERLTAIQELVEKHGANINSQDIQGKTILRGMMDVYKKTFKPKVLTDITRFIRLNAQPIDVNVADNIGESPYSIAKFNVWQDLVEVMEDPLVGAKLTQPQRQAWAAIRRGSLFKPLKNKSEYDDKLMMMMFGSLKFYKNMAYDMITSMMIEAKGQLNKIDSEKARNHISNILLLTRELDEEDPRLNKIYYRGINPNEFLDPRKIFKSKNKTFVTHNFSSISSSKDVALSFVQEDCCIFEIVLSPKVKLIDLRNLEKINNIFSNLKEDELILEPNLQWEIVEEDKSQVPYVYKVLVEPFDKRRVIRRKSLIDLGLPAVSNKAKR